MLVMTLMEMTVTKAVCWISGLLKSWATKTKAPSNDSCHLLCHSSVMGDELKLGIHLLCTGALSPMVQKRSLRLLVASPTHSL